MVKSSVLEPPLEEAIKSELEPFPGPILPLRLQMSGLYEWRLLLKPPIPPLPIKPEPIPHPPIVPVRPGLETEEPEELAGLTIPVLFMRQELRLDVDGYYPLNMASGTIFGSPRSTPVQWIASLVKAAAGEWNGSIWYKDPTPTTFPYTKVNIKVTRTFLPGSQKATVTFTGPGITAKTLTFDYKSAYYHPINFEYDFVEGITPDVCYNTGSHPNHPATLPAEKLTIETIYRRAGVDVSLSPGNKVPLSLASNNKQWSDQEMHDAMVQYWSHFANIPQWAIWVFFANEAEMGHGLGGIMFDDIGPNHRQGCAIFYDSFISDPPAGDPNATAAVERMKFWTAVHEMGHTFNLAHSWQKGLGVPWIPLVNDPAALSYMNYPYTYPNGPGQPGNSQQLFFSNFAFRFTDPELLFMRHAPFRFVEQGNAAWFDHHGFEQANISPEPAFRLEVRTNRKESVLEFLEPVTLELKLTNITDQPVLVPDDLLLTQERMTIVTKREGMPAKQFRPFAQYCRLPKQKVLMPGESMYESLFVSVNRNGWDIAEPGYYTVQLALRLENEDIVSNPLRLRVTPPRSYEEEFLAQDYFSKDVGRIFTFDGSQILAKGNEVLTEVAEQLKDRKVAIHARVALGMAIAREYKLLKLEGPGTTLTQAARAGRIELRPPQAEEARKALTVAFKEPEVAAESLGHIDYRYYADRFSDFLSEEGATKEAVKLQDQLYQTLSTRKVLDSVLKQVRERREKLESKSLRAMKVAS